MVKLIPNLFDLVLNNVSFKTGINEKKLRLSPHDLLYKILYSAAYRGTKLMRLKISKINLSDEKLVFLITEAL